MEYIETLDNIEIYYFVTFDRELLKKYLDEIIKKASYRIKGDHTAPWDAVYQNNTFISGASLSNGDPMFEDIERIYRFTSKGSLSYHDDSIGVVGTLVIEPTLARIVKGLLDNNETSIYEFFDYASNRELMNIDERIADVNNRVNEIDNFDFENKIEAIKSLKRVYELKINNQYFDNELLTEYYLKIRDAIKLYKTKTVIEDPSYTEFIRNLKINIGDE